MVVYTPAVPHDHGEYRWFREHGFCVEKRSQMLGHLSAGKYVMAVAVRTARPPLRRWWHGSTAR